MNIKHKVMAKVKLESLKYHQHDGLQAPGSVYSVDPEKAKGIIAKGNAKPWKASKKEDAPKEVAQETKP